MSNFTIIVVGIGYVGLSNALLLSQSNQVIALDIDKERIEMLASGISPIDDADIKSFLLKDNLNFTPSINKEEAYESADFIIIATPTNYDPETNYFNTESVETVIEEALCLAPDAYIVVKSTIPVGFTKNMREKYNTDNITFSPEFLREGKALHDNLYPSRIIIGDDSEEAKVFAQELLKNSYSGDTPILYTNSTEAEAIKLFANTYLAMRVSFFNELDTYAETHHLNSKQIIEGIGLDPRIGSHYNNPSFGYGGYCLPKDTKQLLANFDDTPNELMKAIVSANRTRKDFITSQILAQEPKIVGIYRLVMKTGSDNFRSSSIQGIMRRLRSEGVNVIVFEPNIKDDTYQGYTIVNDLKRFTDITDIIVANRISKDLETVIEKVYTRDVFGQD